jgi:glycosyltransferase involved in cell wall biosynthesis
MRRLRVLLSAYCCEPGRGSEPGVGWNVALGLARHHDVWVLTRASNRATIEAALPEGPPPGLKFVYYDLPAWARWWKRGMRGLQLYYYLWQVGAGGVARALHRRIGFDLAHHLTLGKYWAPTFLWRVDAPLVWGPLGGGESAPITYYGSYGLRGVVYELSRTLAQWLARLDPFVNMTARRSRIALVATPDTASRVERLGARCVRQVPGQTGVSDEDMAVLDGGEDLEPRPFRVLTVGRLLHWKALHLGLAAFARAELADAEYWIIGDGPEEDRLRRLAASLGLRDRVIFRGQVPRHEALVLLRRCDVLMHPSVHDFSPTVVFEAMAARKPVICLGLGGPAVQVSAATGVVVPAADPTAAVAGLARALRRLESGAGLRRQLGAAGRERVEALHTWDRNVGTLLDVYSEVVGDSLPTPDLAGRGQPVLIGSPS